MHYQAVHFMKLLYSPCPPIPVLAGRVKIKVSEFEDYADFLLHLGNNPKYDKLRLTYSEINGRENINNRLYHIRGYVDDQIVVRRWLKRKGYWHYECLCQIYISVNSDQLTIST